MQSMLGIHSVSKTHEAIREAQNKEPQSNGANTVTVVHEVSRERESEKTQTNGGK